MNPLQCAEKREGYGAEISLPKASNEKKTNMQALINGVGGPLGLMQLLQMQGRGGGPPNLNALLSNPEPIRRVRVAALTQLQTKVNVRQRAGNADPIFHSFSLL